MLAQPVCGKNCNIFFRKRGGGGGQRPFGNFPEIHRYLKRRASLSLRLSLRKSFSVLRLTSKSDGICLQQIALHNMCSTECLPRYKGGVCLQAARTRLQFQTGLCANFQYDTHLHCTIQEVGANLYFVHSYSKDCLPMSYLSECHNLGAFDLFHWSPLLVFT